MAGTSLSHRIKSTEQISYKIKIICGIFIAALLTFCTHLQAQALNIISNRHKYSASVRKDPQKSMLLLSGTKVFLDLRYARADNFTRTVLYKQSSYTFLRQAPASALSRLAQALADSGLAIKVFDAYRPYAVTKKMWELIHDDRYVADPSKGSGHNRGLAIDLTLVRLSDSSELDMGTGFDNFTDSAHHSFSALAAQVLQNRRLLRRKMEQFGFKALETEWWHYSWPNDRDYEVLNVDFKILKAERRAAN